MHDQVMSSLGGVVRSKPEWNESETPWQGRKQRNCLYS